MAELKPCPFCGRPVTGEWNTVNSNFFAGTLWITHDKMTPKNGRCVFGIGTTVCAGSADEAAKIWNRRNGSDERTEK